MSPTHEEAPLYAILGKVPSGIYILTARHGEDETGMLASWVMQAGFDPPMVTVAINRKRYLMEWLSEGEFFALNVVGEEGKRLLSHFGRGFEPGEAAFEGLALTRGEQDLPLLREGVIGHLICRPLAHLDAGDHRIFSAEVVAGALCGQEHPLVHVRKSGAGY
jgi:flavin reductase (DIM6/NTAB) family NADH-FMN oxidoreductase RutF